LVRAKVQDTQKERKGRQREHAVRTVTKLRKQRHLQLFPAQPLPPDIRTMPGLHTYSYGKYLLLDGQPLKPSRRLQSNQISLGFKVLGFKV
jgi:hypothetical protein